MAKQHNLALDRLRIFLTLLVVAHHSALAYVRFGHFDPQHYLWSTAPVVDSHQWLALDVFVLFNDSFFMALMFFLSGLFVWPSLTRKGSGQFMKDRVLRLGAPFAAAVFVLMPLAHYPSFRLTGSDVHFGSFWWDTLTIGPWPGGPAWFVWVLLAFDAVAAGVWRLTPSAIVPLRRLAAGTRERPIGSFAILLGLSAIAYSAMALPFGTARWLTFGPFAVQASRVLFYAVYFVFGVAIGAGGIEKSFLSSKGALSRRWVIWVAGGLASFLLLLVLQPLRLEMSAGRPPVSLQVAYHLVFVICCAALAYGVTAVFLRFGNGRTNALDRLRGEAYGIYLVHYVFAVWLQYALLEASIAGALKAAIVFLLTVTLSWTLIMAIRKLPRIAEII